MTQRTALDAAVVEIIAAGDPPTDPAQVAALHAALRSLASVQDVDGDVEPVPARPPRVLPGPAWAARRGLRSPAPARKVRHR